MSGWKDLILSDILPIVFINAQALEIKILLLVVPLDLDHGLVWLLLAATLFDDP